MFPQDKIDSLLTAIYIAIQPYSAIDHNKPNQKDNQEDPKLKHTHKIQNNNLWIPIFLQPKTNNLVLPKSTTEPHIQYITGKVQIKLLENFDKMV